ncbi:hypothetical protein DITRI_Ditri02bG0083900 [Diplodiscus trichospermus]
MICDTCGLGGVAKVVRKVVVCLKLDGDDGAKVQCWNGDSVWTRDGVDEVSLVVNLGGRRSLFEAEGLKMQVVSEDSEVARMLLGDER